VFESILWKPQIRWQITRIEVLKPIRWINLRRNEVGAVVSTRNVQQAMNAGSGSLGLSSKTNASNAPGSSARRGLPPACRTRPHPRPKDPLVKYSEMFARRAGKGQCVNQPYLGCREFAADWLVTDPGLEGSPIAGNPRPRLDAPRPRLLQARRPRSRAFSRRHERRRDPGAGLDGEGVKS
jgi:CRISPR-associated protein Cas5d